MNKRESPVWRECKKEKEKQAPWISQKKKKKKNPNEQNYIQPDWAETEGLPMSLLHRIKFMHLRRRDRQGG